MIGPIDRRALSRQALYDEHRKEIERGRYKRWEHKMLTYTKTGIDLVKNDGQFAVGLRLTRDGWRLKCSKESILSKEYWRARAVLVQLFVARVEAFIIGHGW